MPTIENMEIARQAKKTAQGLIDTLLLTRKRGDTDTEALVIRTFETISRAHRKATGKGLMIGADWTLQEIV